MGGTSGPVKPARNCPNGFPTGRPCLELTLIVEWGPAVSATAAIGPLVAKLTPVLLLLLLIDLLGLLLLS